MFDFDGSVQCARWTDQFVHHFSPLASPSLLFSGAKPSECSPPSTVDSLPVLLKEFALKISPYAFRVNTEQYVVNNHIN